MEIHGKMTRLRIIAMLIRKQHTLLVYEIKKRNN